MFYDLWEQRLAEREVAWAVRAGGLGSLPPALKEREPERECPREPPSRLIAQLSHLNRVLRLLFQFSPAC